MSAFVLLYFTLKQFSSLPFATAAPIDSGTVSSEGEPALVGFQPGDDTRSTTELLTTCYITYIACVWKSIHANRIPCRSKLSHFWYKLYWAMAAILAPEFVLWASMSQYIQAQILQAVWWGMYSEKGDDWKWWGIVKWEEFLNWCPKAWCNFLDWWPKKWGQFLTWCPRAWKGFLDWCPRAWKGFLDWWPKKWGQFLTWCPRAWKGVLIWCPEKWGKFTGWCQRASKQKTSQNDEGNVAYDTEKAEAPEDHGPINSESKHISTSRRNEVSPDDGRDHDHEIQPLGVTIFAPGRTSSALFPNTPEIDDKLPAEVHAAEIPTDDTSDDSTDLPPCKPRCLECKEITRLKTHDPSDKTYEYRSLPMVVAQFALMGGFILKLKDATEDDRERWLKQAKIIQDAGKTPDSMELIMQGLRHTDTNDLLEDISNKSFITTIRGRGFYQLLIHGAFDDRCVRRRIADKSAHEIVDKCKADSVSKALVCLQVTWMLLNVIARKFTGLPVTLLETHVVIQVGIAVITYAFWWNKPLDAQEAIEIWVTKEMVEKILASRDFEVKNYTNKSSSFKRFAANSTSDRQNSNASATKLRGKRRLQEFKETGFYAFLRFPSFHIPDFITESDEPESMFESFMRAGYDICETFFNLYWYTGIKYADLKFVDANKPYRTPLSTVHRFGVIITALLGAVDGILHLIAWNQHFPTRLEKILWRVACFIGGGLPMFLLASQGNQLEYYPAVLCFGPRRFAKGKYTFWRCTGDVLRAFHRIGTMRYGKELHHVWYNELARVVRVVMAYLLLLGSIVCIVALGFINFEAAFSMRRLPETCYKSIVWVEYIPHF